MDNNASDFSYSDERFADIQMLRYRLGGFEHLSCAQKSYIYCLSQATLYGRDITFDQFCGYNLLIRKTLEAVVASRPGLTAEDAVQMASLTEYLKRVWFSNGIHHHYGCEKLRPGFTPEFLCRIVKMTDPSSLPLTDNDPEGKLTALADSNGWKAPATADELVRLISPVIFDERLLSKRVNKDSSQDIVKTSACNYYNGVSQQQVEDYYNQLKQSAGERAPSFGLNSKLVAQRDGKMKEVVYRSGGLYGAAIDKIVYWLEQAAKVAETQTQKRLIAKLISYYKTGDLRAFDDYSIQWVEETEGNVDFINGFIEVYGDPLGLKASWEGIVEYKDAEASRRTSIICRNAQWFEDHSPIAPQFRKKKVKGVTACVVNAVMLGGDEYPSTAIGINLPNADWIRKEHGSKSVTIGNLTEAYNQAAKGNGFLDEFVNDPYVRRFINRYGDVCDDLHTDMHECLGHGSGQLLPGTDPDALKAYGNTIEEARADLFALYFMGDPKMTELGLLPDAEAYKAQYYTYIMNGLMTQLVRVTPGNDIEEAHMRNRSLIARWCFEKTRTVDVEKDPSTGKLYVTIRDYEALRHAFGQLLAEIQRIKSEGDYHAAADLVETYAVHVPEDLHKHVLERYNKLHIAPYKGFINPVLTPVRNETGEIVDVTIDYSEGYAQQMMRYSHDYGTLI